MKFKGKIRKRKRGEKFKNPEAPEHLKESGSISCNGIVEKGKLPAVFQPRFLEQTDGRHHVIKLLKERTERLKTETRADSLAKQILVERASFLCAIIETNEVHALENNQLDVGSYVQSINALIGLLKTLGLELNGTEITLADHIKNKDRKKKKKLKRKKSE